MASWEIFDTKWQNSKTNKKIETYNNFFFFFLINVKVYFSYTYFLELQKRNTI